MIRKFLLGCVITLSVTVAFAQQPSPNTPSVDRLRQVITYLASDALEGRRTGTPGANEAARYIAGEFSRLGLRAAAQPSPPTRTQVERLTRYFQPFPYVSRVELGRTNSLTKWFSSDSAISYRVNEEWLPLGFSSNARVQNTPVVFAGYGISSAELKYNDYATSNARDRIAIVFAGTPDGDNPHGQFVQAGQIRFKAAAARAAGARALMIIASEEKLKDDRLSRLSYDNSGEAGIPVIVISRQLAATILDSQQQLSEFEKAADSRNTIDEKLRRPMSGRPLTLSVDVIRRESPSFNVVGILRGSDPILNQEAIVIGAHYDHLGRGGEGSLAPREGEIHHGADDNASGVAGLIELAHMLSTQNPKLRRTIVFIAFSGEEEGLIG
ncbi:MAG TPA: M20/M25/M40 family metallo-hydrolase, partial [Pyrinomonadaceae bacterium]|nr:M20/M25/M40 family metallo-hydrolase [Pyrinomonadaceae bacterium]